MGQVAHALLTRPPLSHPNCFLSQQAGPFNGRDASFDLHVLGTPPAFILSQDQTLMLKCCLSARIRQAVVPCPRLPSGSGSLALPIRLILGVVVPFMKRFLP